MNHKTLRYVSVTAYCLIIVIASFGGAVSPVGTVSAAEGSTIDNWNGWFGDTGDFDAQPAGGNLTTSGDSRVFKNHTAVSPNRVAFTVTVPRINDAFNAMRVDVSSDSDLVMFVDLEPDNLNSVGDFNTFQVGNGGVQESLPNHAVWTPEVTYRVEFRDINYTANTYDVWINNHLAKQDASFWTNVNSINTIGLRVVDGGGAANSLVASDIQTGGDSYNFASNGDGTLYDYESGTVTADVPGWFSFKTTSAGGDEGDFSSHTVTTDSINEIYSGNFTSTETTKQIELISVSGHYPAERLAFSIKPLDFTPDNTDHIDIEMYEGDDLGMNIRLQDGGTNGGNFGYINSAGTFIDSGYSWRYNITYVIEARNINYTSNTADFYINGELAIENAEFRNDIDGIERFRLQSSTDGASGPETRTIIVDEWEINSTNYPTSNFNEGLTEDFEDNTQSVDQEGFSKMWYGNSENLSITNNAINGNHALEFQSNGEDLTVYEYTVRRNELTTFSWNARISSQTASGTDQAQYRLRWNDNDVFFIRFGDDGAVDSNSQTNLFTWTAGTTYNITVTDIDYSANTLDLYVNGTQYANDMAFQSSASGIDEFGMRNLVAASGETRSIYLDDLSLGGCTNCNVLGGTAGGTLSLDIQQWMDHGSTQPYEVFRTFDNGTTTEVTNQASVSSSDSGIVSVTQSNSTLHATNDKSVNDVVVITAQVDTLTTTENVTVANRTLSNIAIMPSSQWLNSALGCDEEGVDWCMGSEIQWIFLAIFIGAGAAWRARNEWLGIGVIIGALTLFWTLEYVSLGIMLVALFYGVFAAYQLVQTPSRSDTNVGGQLRNRFP